MKFITGALISLSLLLIGTNKRKIAITIPLKKGIITRQFSAKKTINRVTFKTEKVGDIKNEYTADIGYGLIGTADDAHPDNAYDNIFHVTLPRKIKSNEIVSLRYQLKGVTGSDGIVRSINDAQGVGGYFVKFNNSWTDQCDFISGSNLRRGDNVIRFGLPSNAVFHYEVKNVRIVVEKRTGKPVIQLNTKNITYFKNSIHVSGVANTNDKLYYNGQPLAVHNGEFEFLIGKSNKKGISYSGTIKQISSGKTKQNLFKISAKNLANRSFEQAEKGVLKNGKYNFSQSLSFSLVQKNGTASIYIPAGALPVNKTISITALRQEDIPPLNPDMINLTSGAKAYRFLPHGSRFSKPAHLQLPYDERLIPMGYSKSDVRNFYFDEIARLWVALPPDMAKMKDGLSASFTMHFTDMISGIIKVPESPQTQGYTPTSIKDYKAADPSSGIDLIAPPVANNSGNASLSYPLKIPKGRLGMQPTLALQYNNEGGNGALGLGWNLSIPSIGIDTRWGVPRYDHTLETENYIINGQQLAPLANRSSFVARTTEKIFHSRVEGAFDKIVRHGDNPTNYWWEITNKNGVRSFYGGSPSAGLNNEAILKDGSGNIAQWGLVETRDLHDNFVKYEYQIANDVGVAGGSITGTQLYIKEISYTGNGSTLGNYHVNFNFQNLGRKDVEINARLGFEMVTARQLTDVQVSYKQKLIRSYKFNYTEGEFFKQLLTDVSELKGDGSLFYAHQFEYYNDVTNGGSQNLLGAQENWSPSNDHIKGDLINPLPGFTDESSALNTVKSNQAGGSLAVTIGIGVTNDKSNTIGGSVGYEGGTNEGLVTMVDINGDGLPDKIFKKNGVLSYRPNLGRSSHGFGEVRPISGVNNFSSGKSKTTKAGIQVIPLIFSLGYEHSTTTNTTQEYFSDFNGDGLIDIASNGQVYFNHLDSNGDPQFEIASTNTPSPILPGGAVDQSFLKPDLELQKEQEDQFPLQDAVRLWVAPFDGVIAINAPLRLLPDKTSGQSNQKQDGVRATIQQNTTLIWGTPIAKGDYSVKTPNSVSNIAVKAGDQFFFRVQSIYNGESDAVQWDPEIKYQNALSPALDVNNKPFARYKASEDFILDDRRGLKIPKDGTINIDGNFFKSITSDDVRLVVKKQDTSGNISVLFTKTFNSATIANNLPVAISDIPVHEKENLFFYVESDSYVDRSVTSWLPHYYYFSFNDHTSALNNNNKPIIEGLIVPDNSNYNQWKSIAPVFSTAVKEKVTITPDLTISSSLTGKIAFTVKADNQIFAKQILQVNNGVVSNINGIDLVLEPAKKYYFDYSSADPDLASAITHKQVTLDHISTFDASGNPISTSGVQHVDASLYTNPIENGLGPLFRGWGQFSLKGVKGDTGPIDLSKLNSDQWQQYPNDPNAYTDPTTLSKLPNPTQADFIPMYANGKLNLWSGPDTAVFVAPTVISSSRLFLHDVSADISLVGASLSAPLKVNVSKTDNYAASAGFGGSYSKSTSTTKLDMMDMNGDRYPDVLNENSIQYTQPIGGLESTVVEHGLGGNVGKGTAEGKTLGGGFINALASNFTSQQSSHESLLAEAVIGLSGSVNTNSQQSDMAWLDINGDGLPDKVYKNDSVALNLGYRFAKPERWGINDIDKNSSKTVGGGYGTNFISGSFEAGFGLSRSEGNSSFMLADINGDGLTDQIFPDGVQLNTGNHFEAKIPWSGLDAFSDNVSTAESINAAFTVTFHFPLFFIPIKICVNPSVDASHSVSREQVQLMDIDGDGYPDMLHSDNDGDLQVRRSLIGRTNMLSSVSRPMKGSFRIDYARLGNTYNMPQNKWVLSKVDIADGITGDGIDTIKNTFVYEGGYYDRYEREFYGFKTVTTNQIDLANQKALYRSTVKQFENDNYYKKGLIKSEWLQDGNGKKFNQTDNRYDIRPIQNSVGFPALLQINKSIFEGQASTNVTEITQFDYDELGNMIKIADMGDGSSQDLTIAKITYHNNNAAYIKAVPSNIEVNTIDGLKRHRSTTINQFGDVTQIKQFLADGTTSVYDLKYSPVGNLSQITRPENHKGQRLFYSYEYDSEVNTYVTKVTDAYGYSSTSEYEYLFGNVVGTTSMNNEKMRIRIDSVGRIKDITGPYELAKNKDYTIRFDYHPNDLTPNAVTHHYDPENNQDINVITFMDGLGRAIQVKKDASLFVGKGQPDVKRMIVSGKVIYDAFGRAAQNFYPITEAISATNNLLNKGLGNINDSTAYDVQDRPLKEVLADGTTTTLGYATSGLYLVTTRTDALRNIRRSLTDIKGRKREEQAEGPSGTISTKFNYDALDQLLDVTDNSGNKTLYTYDDLGRKSSVTHPDAGLTNFVYDPASNLIKKITAQIRKEIPNGGAINYLYDFERVTDIDYPRQYQNHVTYTYGSPKMGDQAGRIILQEDASGGLEYFYGPLGEITKQIRTVLVNNAFFTTYVSEQQYDTWNRIKKMTYPDGEVVTYNYNVGGSLKSITGDKGGNNYAYVNQLGYDEFEQRVYLLYGNNTDTHYTYDPQRRRLTGLQAKTASGRDIMHNSYAYDPVSNILNITNNAKAVAGKLGGYASQDYTYDKLYRLTTAKGTYLGVNDTAKYNLAMTYDDLYNVTHKKMTLPKAVDSYDLDYNYGGTAHQPSKIGNDEFKYDLNGNQLKYTNFQNYWDEENRLMAVNHGGTMSEYSYDASGERVIKSSGPSQGSWVNGVPAGSINHNENYTVYVSPYLVCNRNDFTKHIYIESQRITTKVGSGGFTNISFPQPALTAGSIDYALRAKKLQQQRIEYYAQQGVSPGPPSAKLFYAEPQNNGIAAPILIDNTAANVPAGWPGGAPSNVPGGPAGAIPSNDSVKAGYGFKKDPVKPFEDQQYFYHSDHLGSISYVTNLQGEVEQHVEYTAFGETYFEDPLDTYNSRYLFNAKERDIETGYYYYGARYYNPKFSQWISVDPMAEKYQGVSPYNYTLNNPVRMGDPTGMAPEDYFGIGASAILDVVPGVGLVKGVAQAVYGKDLVTGRQLAPWERAAGVALGFVPVAGGLAKDALAGARMAKAANIAKEAGELKGVSQLEASVISEEVQYTKSNLRLGQEMHKAYKVGEDGIKEFRLPSGKRIDFLDIKNNTIYELKPFNPRAMKEGLNQLNMYKQELQTMPQFKGIDWKTILDTY